MMIKPVYEFLLWQNCHNNCKFCFQADKAQLDHKGKLKSLQAVKAFLESEHYVNGSHILLVGGEIFDSPKDFDILEPFLLYILKQVAIHNIDLLYVNTNLIYKKLDLLEYFLNTAHSLGILSRIKFTTSYDVIGRFANEKSRELMLNNLDHIISKYKGLKVVVNLILTKQACEEINSSRFVVKDFEEKHHCSIALIPYIIRLKELTAYRSSIFSALVKTASYYPNPQAYLLEYIKNLDLKQEKRLYQFDGNQLNYCSSDNSSCGHSENFKLYSKDNTCFICDLKQFLQEYI